MTVLETERLLLRPHEASDADFVLETYRRPEVTRYIGTGQTMRDRDEALARIARWRSFSADPPHAVWLVADRTTGAPLGTALLIPLPASGPTEPLAPSGETEIGWHFHPDAWGRGIATEAAGRVLAYAFESGLSRVLAVTNPANTASQAVARRIGMRDEGLTDAYYNTTCALFRVDRGAAQRPPSASTSSSTQSSDFDTALRHTR